MLGHLQGLVQQRAEGQHRQVTALSTKFRPPPGQPLQVPLNCLPDTRTTRVPNRHRLIMLVGCGQKLAALGLVSRARHAHVGYATRVGDVEHARMGGAISTDQAGTVQGEHHGQILQGDVMDQLIVSALQEGGIDGHHRLEPFARQTCRHRDGVLLGNAHIVVALGKPLAERHQTRPLAHRGCDGHQPVVLGGHVTQPIAEDRGEGWGTGRGTGHQTDEGIESARSVIGHRILLGSGVSLAFAGHHVQQLRPSRL